MHTWQDKRYNKKFLSFPLKIYNQAGQMKVLYIKPQEKVKNPQNPTV